MRVLIILCSLILVSCSDEQVPESHIEEVGVAK